CNFAMGATSELARKKIHHQSLYMTTVGQIKWLTDSSNKHFQCNQMPSSDGEMIIDATTDSRTKSTTGQTTDSYCKLSNWHISSQPIASEHIMCENVRELASLPKVRRRPG